MTGPRQLRARCRLTDVDVAHLASCTCSIASGKMETGQGHAAHLRQRHPVRSTLEEGATDLGFQVLDLLLTCTSWLALSIPGSVLLTIAFFSTYPAASSRVGRMAGSGRGHATSLYLLSYYLGGSVPGSAGGWSWEHSGGNAAAFILLQAAAAWLAQCLWRRGGATDMRPG